MIWVNSKSKETGTQLADNAEAQFLHSRRTLKHEKPELKTPEVVDKKN